MTHAEIRAQLLKRRVTQDAVARAAGTSKAMVFSAPMEAVADLGARLVNVASASISPAPDGEHHG